MPFDGILSLPLELLDEIIDISAQELLTLRCVNKALCSHVTPAAFRKIVVPTTEKSTQGFLELLVTKDIAKHVRVIEILEDIDSYPHAFVRVRNNLRAAFLMLHLTLSLESLIITFTLDETTLVWPFTYQEAREPHQFALLQLDLFEKLAHNPNPLPALQSLHITSWFAYLHDLYDEAPFKRIVASLRDLRLHVQDTEYEPDDDCIVHDFWTFVIGPRVLQPAVNLTSLAMESTTDGTSLIRLDLSSITYPCLTSLTLSGFVWDDTRLDPEKAALQAEDFIVRHGKTLKKLKLQYCLISVPYTRSTPVRSWEIVWNRFAEALTELVVLEVPVGRDMQQERYIHYTPDYGFDELSFSAPGTEQDIPAFEALDAIVKERKKSMSISRVGN
ncbi:hypothetical protein EI94DRAFT_1726154 [Lactarius quietus]|nr:hypothetical protein EI94DRAFT_1726154 [Lactarius quietus]